MDTELRDRWLDRATASIAGAGLRAGAARTAVVELLAREAQCLLSAQEIVEKLSAQGAGSAASTYRVLEELHELGLVRRMTGDDGVNRYEVDDRESRHQHFVDDRSGQVSPISDRKLAETIDGLGDRLGVDITSYELVVRGTPKSS